MSRVIRGLLTLGNRKVGECIHLWSLPPVTTCPGRSEICEGACYARQGRYRFQAVKDRLLWNFEQSLRRDFVPRMVAEIRRKGVLVLRVHCSGDFYSREYAEKWLQIMRHCPGVRFYWYSRSWRVPEIADVLERMAALKGCRAWYSLDAETGVPARVPRGVRLAYLQVGEDERPELLDLMFRVRRLRRLRVPLSLVCPTERPGNGREINCGSCQKCWY